LLTKFGLGTVTKTKSKTTVEILLEIDGKDVFKTMSVNGILVEVGERFD